jgi:glycosyltransferase involved in cell wall biosynthesis
MIITHLNPYRIGIKGGVENYLFTLLTAMEQYGIRSYCFVGGKFKLGAPPFQEYRSYLDLSESDYNLESFIQSGKRAWEESSVVHFHNLHIFAGPGKVKAIHAVLSSRYPTLRLLLSVHNLRDTPYSWDVMHTFGHRNIICYSEFIARTIYEKSRIHPHLLPLCFPFKHGENPPGRVSTHLDVLQPTRFHESKGPHISLAAVVKLLDEGYTNFTFTQAGVNITKLAQKWQCRWDEQFPRLQDRVNYYVSQGKLFFQEYSYYEMVDRISRTDIILHPNVDSGILGEPFSIATAQSIIAERAVIVSSSGFLPELANPEVYNIAQVVPSNHYLALKQALQRWLEEPIPQLTEEGRKYASTLKEKTARSVASHVAFYRHYFD